MNVLQISKFYWPVIGGSFAFWAWTCDCATPHRQAMVDSSCAVDSTDRP